MLPLFEAERLFFFVCLVIFAFTYTVGQATHEEREHWRNGFGRMFFFLLVLFVFLCLLHELLQ